jgi:hypothetical protein
MAEITSSAPGHGSHLSDAFLAGQNFDRQTGAPYPQRSGRGFRGDGDDLGIKRTDLCFELLDVVTCRQSDDSKILWEPLDDISRVLVPIDPVEPRIMMDFISAPLS